MISNQKINGVGRIKFRISVHNLESPYSFIMKDSKFSEFAILSTWGEAFLQQVYSVRYHISVAKNSNRNRKVVIIIIIIIISKENKVYS